MPYKNAEMCRSYNRRRNAGGARRAEWNQQFRKRREKRYLRPWERRMIIRIAEADSVAEAARQVGCSYKTAYDCARGLSRQRQLGHGVQAVL